MDFDTHIIVCNVFKIKFFGNLLRSSDLLVFGFTGLYVVLENNFTANVFHNNINFIIKI